MWVYLVLAAAFFNALWTSISQKNLINIAPFDFTFIFRAFTALLLFPFFLHDFSVPMSYVFWCCTLATGLLEVIRITLLSRGIKDDYYSTYAIYNAAPIFTILIAPMVLPEKINFVLFSGALLVTLGGVIFYYIGHFSINGLFCAITSSFSGILSKIAIGYSSAYFFIFLSFSIGVLFMGIYGLAFKCFSFKKDCLKHLPKVLGTAFISMLATICYYSSVEIAPITRVSPLVRTNLLFGFMFSYFFLKEKKNWQRKMLAGGCIFLGALCIALS